MMIQTHTPPAVIKILAHNLRWQIVQLLVVGDYRVNELVTLLDQPLNLVSYHLKQLRDSQLVSSRRSEADRRDTYYSLDLMRLQEQYRTAGAALHPVLSELDMNSQPQKPRPKILFVCTHNRARSQIAEGLMRHLTEGQVYVSSAGSEPGAVHPDAVRTMETLGIDIRNQYSKGFDDVIDQTFDFVITVCDRAREVCPTFPGDGQHIHWGFPDPLMIEDPAKRAEVFHQMTMRLTRRIRYFLKTL